MKKQLFIIVILLCASVPLVAQSPAVTQLSADEVMARVFARDSMRESMGGGYSGKREYVLENHHFNKRAEMQVSVLCDVDGTKHFDVLAEDGWKSANKHVLRKMLESESETSLPSTRPKTRLVPANYEFRLIGSEYLQGRPAYVIEAIPQRTDKYLFRGRIWVDAEDFAVARVEGIPAKTPSFWTRSVHFVQQYYKSGAFWFPESTTSVTDARIFGTTDVSIRYFDYSPLSNSARGSANSTPTEVKYVQH
jgi:negative regulator of sigma E activity